MGISEIKGDIKLQKKIYTKNNISVFRGHDAEPFTNDNVMNHNQHSKILIDPEYKNYQTCGKLIDCSNAVYGKMLGCFLGCFGFSIGIPLAIIWGMLFAIIQFLHIFILNPSMKITKRTVDSV